MARPRTAGLALAGVAVTLLALAGAVTVGAVDFPGTPGVDATGSEQSPGEAPPAEALIRPDGGEGLLWPYTSAEQSVAGRTLAINVVIHGDDRDVRQALTDEGSLAWNRTGANETEADAQTHAVVVGDDGLEWSTARGSTRYSYVAVSGERDAEGDNDATRPTTGSWIRPDYQLHAGTYLGTRQHVRAYESPSASDEWTAIQAHAEYWDWFRLRHSVTSVTGAARTVEREFIGEPYVEEVRREYRGNHGGGNDGWITAVELALAALAVGASLRTRSASSPGTLASVFGSLPSSVAEAREGVATILAEHGRALLLPAWLLALYLGVRFGGVRLERAFPGMSPKVFAGVLYPVLAVGLPVAAARTARPLDATPAFALTAGGLGAAFVLDFSTLGLVRLSIRLVLHRFALLVALGLVAAGTARAAGGPDRRLLALGVAGWVVCQALPLFGML